MIYKVRVQIIFRSLLCNTFLLHLRERTKRCVMTKLSVRWQWKFRSKSFYGAVCPYQHVRHRCLSRMARARSANQKRCVGVATVRSSLASGWPQVQQWNVYSTVLNNFICYCRCLELWRVFSVTLNSHYFSSCLVKIQNELLPFKDTTIQYIYIFFFIIILCNNPNILYSII